MLARERLSDPVRRLISYRYLLPGGGEVDLEVELDEATMLATRAPPDTVPPWAALDFHQCAGCPLDPSTSPSCPAAVQLSGVVAHFSHLFSFQRVSVRVVTPERTYERSDVSLQAALSPLIGLLMATSGCPPLSPLRLQARFHLPFASPTETVARATSLYLLAQYFVMQRGEAPDWAMKGLAEVYRAVGRVNRAFANRLRAAATADANVNALIRLDSMGQEIPHLVDDELEELGVLFAGLGPR